MKTNFLILIAISALAWDNVVFASSSEFDDDSANELTDEAWELQDEDLKDEAASREVLTHKKDTDVDSDCSSNDIDAYQCSCMNSYLVTAPNESSFRRLFKKLDKMDGCKNCTVIKRTLSEVLLLTSIRTTAKCATKLAKKGYVVEENTVQETGDALPNVNVFKLQDRIDQTDLPRDGSNYDRNDATDVNIFLLDTGVLTTHNEFNNNNVARALYYIDAVTPNNPNFLDVNGHGTRCASVAIGANIGVAQGATIQSIRIADPQGKAEADDVISGLDDVQRWWNQNQGSKCVISYSLISMATSRTLDYAFANITMNTDCVVLVAAGNQGAQTNTADACDYSPARLSDVITVGASRFRNGGTTDDRLSASNYGPCVDIYAPGRNINLAAPSGTSNSNYLTSSGTSFATPAVAGAAAMILSTTTLTPSGGQTMTDLIRDILIQTSSMNKLTSLPAENAAELPSFNRLLNVADNTYYQ